MSVSFDQLPTIPTDRLAIKVKPSVERIIKQKHPWLFEQGIVKQNKEGKAGDLAIIFDQKKNQYLAVGLYDPYSIIRVKLLQFIDKAVIDEAWFLNKITAAYEQRSSLLKTDTDSYRFIHGENDGLPGFIADVYAKVLVVKLYSFIWLPYLKKILPILLQTSQCQTIVLRLSRQLQQNEAGLHGLQDGQVIYGKLEEEVVRFREHGLLFNANVIKGHKTGYFLDHRHNRKRVGELSKNKTILDIFAYAGGFSVHALAGGAKEVISLDISAQALEMATQNVALNNKGANHKTMAIDAFKGLEELRLAGKRFDIVVVDPPSFAKKESEITKALHSYARLAKASIKVVEKGGILLLASCSSRVSAEAFFKSSIDSMEASGRAYVEMERSLHDVDHPIGFKEGGYLKSIYFKLI